ncbi:MAG: 1-(5-phosphoribosyl)-5-amino-4-imidazole-carboxylate carboxylase [Firmicutes bacterium HGW-Firmicutes-14]|jgi:hypothetical protein|nr:MAG: 1-(5-phosphoribosyl)-5-amino-4-imidazole-carboxylate carboxylase [Firmicutes bacterium HGW-Firmicutes-14]
MDKIALKKLLLKVRNGVIDPDEAVESLHKLPFEDLGFAKVDLHRNIRKGYPEVIFCQGKNPVQVVEIVRKLVSANQNVLATRAGKELFSHIERDFSDARYYPEARCFTIERFEKNIYQSALLVVSAGTADIPVAEEAAVTAEAMGHSVTRMYDVGVAGIHRLFHHKKVIDSAAVIIVVAGMEGALASVVGGLVDVPVIAVPTSVGYGASFNGLAALLAMLNSCASGIAVVNIDNGFGAAAMANSIIRLKESE